MNKKKLFALVICLLLGGFTGCHEPTKGAILVPDPNATGAPAVYIEEGGSLEFRSEMPTFSVIWTDKTGTQTGPSPCPNDTLTGTSGQTATCNIPKGTATQAYYFKIIETVASQEKGGATPPPPPPPFFGTAYVRHCPSPCK